MVNTAFFDFCSGHNGLYMVGGLCRLRRSFVFCLVFGNWSFGVCKGYLLVRSMVMDNW